jgi:DNA-directed RNA polymerase specialized sigma24 family protein
MTDIHREIAAHIPGLRRYTRALVHDVVTADDLVQDGLARALGQLPAEMRVVVLLVGLEGMPYDAVANILGIPVGTVRSRLSRGCSALRRPMDVENARPILPTAHTLRTPPIPQTLGVSAV